MDDPKSKAERAKALSAALAQIEKQFGKGSIMKLSDGEVVKFMAQNHRVKRL
jgi:recombination protein RecA